MSCRSRPVGLCESEMARFGNIPICKVDEHLDICSINSQYVSSLRSCMGVIVSCPWVELPDIDIDAIISDMWGLFQDSDDGDGDDGIADKLINTFGKDITEVQKWLFAYILILCEDNTIPDNDMVRSFLEKGIISVLLNRRTRSFPEGKKYIDFKFKELDKLIMHKKFTDSDSKPTGIFKKQDDVAKSSSSASSSTKSTTTASSKSSSSSSKNTIKKSWFSKQKRGLLSAFLYTALAMGGITQATAQQSSSSSSVNSNSHLKSVSVQNTVYNSIAKMHSECTIDSFPDVAKQAYDIVADTIKSEKGSLSRLPQEQLEDWQRALSGISNPSITHEDIKNMQTSINNEYQKNMDEGVDIFLKFSDSNKYRAEVNKDVTKNGSPINPQVLADGVAAQLAVAIIREHPIFIEAVTLLRDGATFEANSMKESCRIHLIKQAEMMLRDTYADLQTQINIKLQKESPDYPLYFPTVNKDIKFSLEEIASSAHKLHREDSMKIDANLGFNTVLGTVIEPKERIDMMRRELELIHIKIAVQKYLTGMYGGTNEIVNSLNLMLGFTQGAIEGGISLLPSPPSNQDVSVSLKQVEGKMFELKTHVAEIMKIAPELSKGQIVELTRMKQELDIKESQINEFTIAIKKLQGEMNELENEKKNMYDSYWYNLFVYGIVGVFALTGTLFTGGFLYRQLSTMNYLYECHKFFMGYLWLTNEVRGIVLDPNQFKKIYEKIQEENVPINRKLFPDLEYTQTAWWWPGYFWSAIYSKGLISEYKSVDISQDFTSIPVNGNSFRISISHPVNDSFLFKMAKWFFKIPYKKKISTSSSSYAVSQSNLNYYEDIIRTHFRLPARGAVAAAGGGGGPPGGGGGGGGPPGGGGGGGPPGGGGGGGGPPGGGGGGGGPPGGGPPGGGAGGRGRRVDIGVGAGGRGRGGRELSRSPSPSSPVPSRASRSMSRESRAGGRGRRGREQSRSPSPSPVSGIPGREQSRSPSPSPVSSIPSRVSRSMSRESGARMARRSRTPPRASRSRNQIPEEGDEEDAQ